MKIENDQDAFNYIHLQVKIQMNGLVTTRILICGFRKNNSAEPEI